jgi:hypothetical protein
MQQLIDHHHYKKELITEGDRVAVYERYVVDLLLNSNLTDLKRDSSIAFELKHHHSTAQFARILAWKRRLNEDVCCVGALLHDLYAIVSGSYKDHAHKSAELAEKALNEIGLFSNDEKEKIFKLIYNHSDKDVWSNDPYEELGKDADILDSFLYPNAYGYYLKHKKLRIFYNYIKRAKMIWDEMGIPAPLCFTALDNYDESWLGYSFEYHKDIAIAFFAFLQQLSESIEPNSIAIPTYCITQHRSNITFHFNEINFTIFSKAVLIEHKIDLKDLPVDILKKVSEPYTFAANKLLNQSEQRVLIIWSSLNSYELIDPILKPERIADLGINVTQSEV